MLIPPPVTQGQADWPTFTSDDRSVVINYPANWVAPASLEGFITVLASGEDTLSGDFSGSGAVAGLAHAEDFTARHGYPFRADEPAALVADYATFYRDFLLEEPAPLENSYRAVHHATFNFAGRRETLYAIDTGGEVLLLLVNATDDTYDSIGDEMARSLRDESLLDDIPQDIAPVGDILPQAGEYQGVLVAEGCPEGYPRVSRIHAQLPALESTESGLLLGEQAFAATATGLYQNAAGDVISVHSDSRFSLAAAGEGDCDTYRYFFSLAPTPESITLAADADYALPAELPFERITIPLACPVSETSTAELTPQLSLLDEGQRLRLVSEEGLPFPTVYYYDRHHQPGTFARQTAGYTETVYLSSAWYFTRERHYNDGCAIYQTYRRLASAPETPDFAAEVDDADSPVPDNLEKVVMADGAIQLAYSPDIYDDTYLQGGHSFYLDANDTTPPYEVAITIADEMEKYYPSDPNALSLEEFATIATNLPDPGEAISLAEPVELGPHPTLRSIYDRSSMSTPVHEVFYFMDLGEAGKIRVRARIPPGGYAANQADIEALLATINNQETVGQNVVADWSITLDTGDTLTPDNSELSFTINSISRQPMMTIRGENGLQVQIRLDTGVESGEFSPDGAGDPRSVNPFPFVVIGMPFQAEGETALAWYGSNPTGTFNLNNEGGVLSGTFSLTNEFTMVTNVSRPADMPDTYRAEGTFSGISLETLDQ
jgi:hypothetical protein